MADAGVETETDSRADENDREEEETKEDNSSKPSEFVEDEVSHEQDGAVDEESVDDENQENKEERKNNITQFEMGFLKECTKIVTHMTVKDAYTMFDNSNPKSWLWWPKRGAGSSAETFYARAVGTWYPSKMFHEMQGRIFCPYCDHAISHETGRWVPLKEAREIITFDSTWLLIGREYTCRNKGCGKTIRNTTAEFLKQCPENTRHRFPITMRKKLAIETVCSYA